MRNIRTSKTVFFFLMLAMLVGASGCYRETLRLETSRRIAMPSFMLHRLIAADPFVLTVYERVRKPGEEATLYIEGDGLAWLGKRSISRDPTPKNPVALHLASRDNGSNVIYMARPCQYSKMVDSETCPNRYWTSDRFAPEVINSMNAAISEIKNRYSLKGFHLVGYSGGGAVAELIASSRTDILSIRTVAGNLDHKAFTTLHQVSPMDGSLNPPDIAPKVADIPQHHFIGEWDETVPASIYDSFRTAMGSSTCMRSSIVSKADHETGWVDKWPTLLGEPLDCNVGR